MPNYNTSPKSFFITPSLVPSVNAYEIKLTHSNFFTNPID